MALPTTQLKQGVNEKRLLAKETTSQAPYERHVSNIPLLPS